MVRDGFERRRLVRYGDHIVLVYDEGSELDQDPEKRAIIAGYLVRKPGTDARDCFADVRAIPAEDWEPVRARVRNGNGLNVRFMEF